ncbi:MAG: hypothetical protein ACD_7C00013G0002, partial [uncultured bacterium]
MKKIILFSFLTLALFLLSSQASLAGTWKSPNPPFTDDLMAGNCILVNTVAEKDATHVYTLNPDNTIDINQSYHERWDRNARCDEIQFHVDYSTPISRLNSWLDSVAFSWYENIGTTHFKGQTVSTSRHEWFFVDQNGIHRIPDWLTGLSWGLLIGDRISIPAAHTEAFYEKVAIGTPLNFGEGQYADKIHDIWLEGDEDFSALPASMQEELNTVIAQADVFNECAFEWTSVFPGNPWNSLFDWSWMQRNTG